MLKRVLQGISMCMIAACSIVVYSSNTYAETLQSNTYRFEESAIGTGGVIDASSTNYQVNNSAGDLVVGNSSSANYQVDSGSRTTNDPALSFAITSGAINFGDFSASTSTTTTATFSVTNYTSYGYVVQIVGDTPTSGGNVLPGLPATQSPTVGVEEFGINLVANTIPSSIGANPNNGQFGFGQVAPNYATSNEYRYVSGETIALAPKSSGTTLYTITYMVNVEALTIGGKYTTNQTLIVTGTY